MMLRRFVALTVFVTVLVLAPWMWASGAELARADRASTTTATRASFESKPTLTSRVEATKRPSTQIQMRSDYEPEFIVKFRDQVRARASATANRAVSRGGANLSSFHQIVDQYGLTVTPYFDKSENDLLLIQSKAESRSGRMQPDLAGILRVSGPANVIEQAARAVNALQSVEFVEFTSEVDVDLSELQDGAQFAEAKPPSPLVDPKSVWNGRPVRPSLTGAPIRPRPATLRSADMVMDIDSGPIAAAGRHMGEAEVVFSQMFDVPDVPWIRLFFRDVRMSGSAARGNASYLLITSLLTGETQTLDAAALHQWGNATAFFKGGSILVQLYAYPGTGENRVVIDRAEVGEWLGGIALDICDDDDQRQQSNDPAVGRLMGGGGICSAFLFNDRESCLLSASHCDSVIAAAGATVHFNVPDSLPDGTPVPAAVVDQFPVLLDSAQFEPLPLCGTDVGCEADWSLFGVGDNSAGQSPLQWQGTSHTLATSLPPADGRTIIVRGYGDTTETNAPDTWNHTQTEGVGPLLGAFGTELSFRIDVTGGTSGGPIIDTTTNLVIGVLTCGGCLPFGAGDNVGTGINHPNIVHALANPNACTEGVQGFTGSCCVSGNCFNNVLPSECASAAGTFNGIGTTCPTGELFTGACGSTYLCCSGGGCSNSTYWECEGLCGTALQIYGVGDYECDDADPPDPLIPCNEDPQCGAPGAGDCFTPRATTHCNNEDLCAEVCQIDPFCCDPTVTFANRGNGHWDEICAWHARRLSGFEVHPCFAASGDCDSPNSTPGCGDTGCCLTVCLASPACCGENYNWDPHCVELAEELCGIGSPDQPTPNFEAAQGYLTPTGYFAEYGTLPAGVGAGLAAFYGPVGFPFDFKISMLPLLGWGGEGYDLEGLWQFGELFEGVNGTRGHSIRIGVLAPTAFVHPSDDSQTHEDLRGRVMYPEEDQTMIFNPGSPSGLLDGNLGTAVLGVLAANPDNNSGMRSMVPDAQAYYFPTVSVEEGGRFQNAFTTALQIFEEGDVLVLPYTARSAATPFSATLLGWTLISAATDLGITCVIAAGDDALPILAQAGGTDCGAIVVSAVTPGIPFYKMPFANSCSGNPCPELARVHIGGWGAAVATLGYGDHFLGTTNGQPDLMRSYTTSFGTTSAATAQVGAVAAMMQGLAKQFWDTPLSPNQIRGEISINGFCQGDYCGEDGPGLGGEEIYGDWDLGGEVRRVGSMVYNSPQFPDEALVANRVFTDLPAAAEWVVAEGYFDDCLIDEIYTIRGDHQSGNKWSACALDQNYYVARSVQTNPESNPTSVPEYARALSKAYYSATGQIADVFAVARPSWDVVTSVAVTAIGNTSDGRASVAFIELYNWDLNMWTIAGVNYNPGGAITVATFPFLGVQEFVNDQDNSVLVRVWAYGLPGAGSFGNGSTDVTFDMRLDVIDIAVEGFIDQQD